MKLLLIIMMFMLPVGGAWAENAIGEKAMEFTLQDQYGKTVTLREYYGRTVVLLACDKEGSPQKTGWIKAIRDKYADRVAVQGIADVSSVPFFLKTKIRNDFKKDGDSILLDWKGEVFRSYGFAKAVPNIVLIDGRGVIRHRSSGSVSPEAVQELFGRIDKLH
jgi:peroxiredoxin